MESLCGQAKSQGDTLNALRAAFNRGIVGQAHRCLPGFVAGEAVSFPILEIGTLAAPPTGKGKRQLKIGTSPLNSPFLMAKTSWINRNERKRATVKKYAAIRAELKAKKDYAGLTQLPRDASPTRVVNRCEVTGRRRAFIRRFRMSRLTFRELASQGLIPGVTKSSW